jgi:hypothetical protein
MFGAYAESMIVEEYMALITTAWLPEKCRPEDGKVSG